MNYDHQSKPGFAKWICKCDCGAIKSIRLAHLRSSRSRSCGCLNKEIARKRMTTHGCKQLPEYGIWCSMKSRCTNPNDQSFDSWGGRGITIFSLWTTDFEAFFKYIGSRPSPKHSLDRINNNGNYEPGNVRWATKQQQANNTRCQEKLFTITSPACTTSVVRGFDGLDEWCRKNHHSTWTLYHSQKRGVIKRGSLRGWQCS
jgi:hypothetical protein